MHHHRSNQRDDDGILEGFLCPICKDDLKTPERLTSHVERYHSEEQDLLKSLRGIFNTAKKRLLNFDDSGDLAKNFDDTLKGFTGPVRPIITPIFTLPQEEGADVDHTQYFKAIRTPRLERYATETNKLIIRLHKLVTDRPIEPSQRKIHEQTLVPWLDGKSVKLCPSCARSFHLARRQHHCRLCGSIMCHDCSQFLDVAEAIDLVNPSLTVAAINTALRTDEKDKDTLRICDHCLHLLDNRKEMQDSRTARPPITQLYENIHELKNSIAPDIPMYSKIINSLYEGDSIFHVGDASALRSKIGHVAETVDVISKKILGINTQEGSREEALKKSVRLACIKYIKEELLSLPPLPLEEDIKKIQEKRKRETEMRIERERRLASEAIEKYELENINFTNPTIELSTASNSASGSVLSSLDNWSSHQTFTNSYHSSANDPLLEQMNIIKGYIKQAREAMRFEEVAILEMNYRELQQEFYNQQQLKNS